MAEGSNDFKVTAMLCDSAQGVNGKLYILGGGWNITTTAPQPSALAFVIAVPWGESNRRHKLEVELVDTGGKPFLVNTPAGEQPLRITAEFETGRPPEISPGSYLPVVLAIGIGPLQYKVGRYEWRFRVNAAGSDDWRLPFEVRAAQQTVFHPPRQQ
jgi:hypothetical protein